MSRPTLSAEVRAELAKPAEYVPNSVTVNRFYQMVLGSAQGTPVEAAAGLRELVAWMKAMNAVNKELTAFELRMYGTLLNAIGGENLFVRQEIEQLLRWPP
jgi:hypothetical protein